MSGDLLRSTFRDALFQEPGAHHLSRLPNRLKRVLLLIVASLLVWLMVAYLLLPFAFRHYEHQQALGVLPMVTQTADGMAGDPFNIGLVGTQRQVVSVMHKAGWFPADPVTLRTSIEIIGSVLLDRAYADAPVSPLFFEGRKQDLAFEKAIGRSADRRMHVRFWQALPKGREGRPVWLGAATLDSGVGFSHYTGEVTHAIAPDIDTMRDTLSTELAETELITETYEVSGIGPTLFGRNGEGDRYWTDGEIKVSVIAADGETGTNPPPVLSKPPLIDLKDQAWQTVMTPN